MYVNCPPIDQRTQAGSDNRPPEDGNMDCVPAALASMASALLGGPVQNADAYHDAVYGQGYIGMQDPSRYVGLLAGLGLTLTPFTGSPAALVIHALACIRSRFPVLLSIPSDWNDTPPTSQFAHMIAGCDVDSAPGPSWDQTTLTAMNPWGGFYQTQSLNWWAERLATCAYKATWVMTRTGEGMGIPAGWTDDGTTLHAPNGMVVVRGFRDYIHAATNWPAALVPLAAESGVGANHVQQPFGMLLDWTLDTNVTEVAAPIPAPVQPPDPTAAPLRVALDAFLKG